MRMRRNGWSAYASVLGLTGGFLASLAACSDQAAGEADEVASVSDGVIIGSNDLVRVQPGGSNVPAKYRPLVNAFGRLARTSGSSYSGFCTATHLGNGIAVSAGHCWSAGATRQNNIDCTTSSTCRGHVVQWGYTSGGTASVSNITSILAMQVTSGTSRLDYAYFRVSPVPPDAIPVDWSGKAPSGTTLTIFSHPGARTLEWSTTCALQSPGSTQLSYQCDTEGGSSGATVLNDSNLKVAAIHWGGASSGNSATYILSTPVGDFLQPDGGGGTGGTGGAGGADGGGKDGGDAGGAGGKDGGGDGSIGDAPIDVPFDVPFDVPSDVTDDGSDGAAGSAGAAGAAGAGGTGGTAGTGGAAGSAGTGGAAGKGGAAGSGGAAGKGGSAGSGGSTGGGAGSGGAAGSGGTGGATGGSAGSGGTTGGRGGSGGKGGTSAGGSSGSGGTTDDGGCSCRVGPGASSSGDHLRGLLAAFAVGLVSLRRARRKPNRTTS